jgi:hypothetical protein
MVKEVAVYLYPPQGGGVQIIKSLQGEIPVPVPHIQYSKVRGNPEVTHYNGYWAIRFTTRTGEIVESNLPYTVVETITGD